MRSGHTAHQRSRGGRSMTQIARLLSAWTAWALSRRYLVLGAAFALALASVGFTALKLDFQTSRLSLMAPHHPLVQLTQRLAPFEQRDDFTVVVEAPTPHRAVAFVQEVVRRLQQDPTHFQEVFFRVDPALVRPWALLYLDGEDLIRLRDRLAEYPTLIQGLLQHPDLQHFFRLVNQEMASRMVGALFTDFLKAAPEEESATPQPRMDLGFLIQTLDGMRRALHGEPGYQSPWATFFQEASWDRELAGYFWVAEKRYLLFFVTPVRAQGTFNQARVALAHLRSVLQEARAMFADVQVGVTGQDALNADEMTVSLRDISWATWISLAGAWLIIALFFRSQGRTFVRILSLSVGLCWTFGLTTLCIGHLNILSMVFAPMLNGLGVDYGLHWFARLEEEERDPGLSSQEVILRVATRSGPGILLAAVSASCAFLPLILTGFTGLAELGLISGVGILCSVLADLVVLPLLSLPAKRRYRAAPRRTTSDTTDLLAFTRRRAAWVLVGAGSLCLLSLWSGWRVGFDANPLHLQARGTESVVWAERLRQHSTHSVIFAAIVADSAEEVAAKTAALERLPEVWKVRSVLSLLPAHQEEKIPLLRAVGADLATIDHSPSASPLPDPGTLEEILERIRFKMDEEQADRWGAQRPLIDQIRQVRILTAEILEALHGAAPGRSAALGVYQRQFQEDLCDVVDLLAQG